jgi:hypothetical protein
MILIEATKDSPLIRIDSKKGKVEISGPSYPPNALKVYEVVIEWLDSIKPGQYYLLVMDFYYSYLNSSSKSALLEILKILETLVSNSQNVEVNWIFAESDEDMNELGEELSSMFRIPFSFVAKSDE